MANFWFARKLEEIMINNGDLDNFADAVAVTVVVPLEKAAIFLFNFNLL